MNAPVLPPGDGDRIVEEPLSEALSRRYLAYALSVITDRALPDDARPCASKLRAAPRPSTP